MLVLHGFYRFARKLVAYRNDYCFTCDAPRLAFQHRTVDVYHLFFIPLLPLGIWKRWHCSICGHDPHATYRTRKPFKWIGTLGLLVLSLLAWLQPPEDAHTNGLELWGFRFGLPLAFALALRATLEPSAESRLSPKLRAIQPIVDPICPVCSTMLLPQEPAWKCPKCGIARCALPAA